MCSPAVASICVLFSAVLGFPMNASGLHVSTKRVTRSIDDSVRLNCSDPLKTPLHWMHKSVGSKYQTHIYNSFIITNGYERGGRHSVELDDSSGSCDLLIKQLSVEDAGTYTCRRDDGDHLEIELIIIVSMPTCESSSNLTDVLVENDCGLEPDVIQLKCRIGYKGNMPPTLEWRHSLDPDIIVPGVITNQWISDTDIKIINSLITKTSSIQWNGTNFICSVDEVEAGERSFGCATKNVSVTCLFNSTESQTLEISDDDEEVNISCMTNMSQTCNYRWRLILLSTGNPVEILGQTIRLTSLKHDVQDMRCLAECRIKDSFCIVEPIMLKFTQIAVNSSERITDSPFIPTWLLCGLLVILAISITVLILKFKIAVRFFGKRQKLFWELTPGKKNISKEEQLLHDCSDSFRDDVRKTIKCLQPNKSLFDRLMSSGLLSVEKHKTLIEEDQDTENLLKILTLNINTRRTFNSFLAVLIESDQYFRVVDSTVIEAIRTKIHKLIECLDVDNGLADSLFSRGVLSSEQYERLTNKSFLPSSQEQNRELLSNMLPSRMKSDHACKMFMAALVETDQRHVFNFIMDLEDFSTHENGHRPLTAKELRGVERSSFHLINSIDPSPTFLESLLREDCITQRHKNRIDAQQTSNDKNKELLSIMRRRSYEDFETFKRVIQETHKDGMIVKLLEQESGHVISVHCEINMEPGALEHLSETEAQIASHISDPTILSQSLPKELTEELNGLHTIGIDVIGANPHGSVIVLFSCQTFQSIVAFKQLVVNGELTRILEELFNFILGLLEILHFNLILSFSPVKLTVSLSETEYRSCIDEARRTIYTETDSTSQQCFIRILPRELLEIILLKSMVGIMSVEWMMNVRDSEPVSGSYNLYDTVTNKTWMSANISLKSVTYQWMPIRLLNRGTALRQYFFRRLQEHYTMFVEQLNCRYVFVDCLEKEGIITEEERRNIMEADDDVATRTDEDIPESCWPQMRDSEQMLMSNKKLLKCLSGKNYSQIAEFLKLMEGNDLTHVLNYFITNEESFGDVWPLKNAQRITIIRFGTSLVRKMNILALLEVRGEEKKSGEESRMNDDGSNRDRQNLIDLLYNEGCISLPHKQHIEQQPTQQLQNLEMLQLIKNGSIKTFKVALEYFRVTNQDDVFDMLNRKYCSEEIMLSEKTISMEETQVMGVAWLEETIYVTLELSNIVHVYPDQRTFDGSEDGNIELKGMKNSRDMVASKLSRSIFISDLDNLCLWKIQMPGKSIFRWNIDGRPGTISISSSNVLIVCVENEGRSNLSIYRSPDVNLMKSITLPTKVKSLKHAIQLLNGNFIISHSMDDDPYVFLIDELSVDGKNIIRDFDPRSIDSNRLDFWTPFHLSIDEDDNIFIADRDNDRVILLNSRWTDVQILLNRDQHSIESPSRLCYVREKQQLIVANVGRLATTCDVLVHNLQSSASSTDPRILKNELELIKFAQLDSLELNRCDILNPSPSIREPIPDCGPTVSNSEGPIRDRGPKVSTVKDIQLVKRFEVKEGSTGCRVLGVTWLENKIYVACCRSNRVHVFPDQEPFEKLKEEKIIIEEMKLPLDISASTASRSIFITDQTKLMPGNVYMNWKIQLPDGEIIPWMMNGRPFKLSVTSWDELVVVVGRDSRFYLDLYSCLDVDLIQSIPLPTDIEFVKHAVRLPSRDIIISYSKKCSPDMYQISELSMDGTNFVRSFNPRSNIQSWSPDHLSFDDDGHLFVVDWRNSRVHLLSSQLSYPQILLKRYRHQLRGPQRLCYVREKQQLIVGQTGPLGEPGLVSVFNVRLQQHPTNKDDEDEDDEDDDGDDDDIHPQQHPMNIEHEQEPNDEQ